MKISVKVKPGSNEQEIKKQGDLYIVNLKCKAEDNKANIELIKMLKKHFNAKEVRIKSGKSSRRKVVEVVK